MITAGAPGALFVITLWAGVTSYAMLPGPLETLLSAEAEARNMPGLRAAVRCADGRETGAAVGFADLEARTPLDETTPMPGGSTGKTFVAAVAMLLYEDGVLQLSDRASRWLGDEDWFQRLPNAQTMRVADLLSHSAGLVDYPRTLRFQLANAWRRIRHGSAYFTPEELIGFAADRRALFAAGQGFAYSDTGYLVLGRLLEKAAGESYYSMLRKRVLEPLALQHVQTVDAPNPPGVPNGYFDAGWFGFSPVLDDRGRMKFDPASEWTGGGLNLTPRMLVRFIAALTDGAIVRQETFRLMLDGGYRPPANEGYRYGYGLFVNDTEKIIMHGGRWPGYRSWVSHDLSSGTTIAVQTNRDASVDLPSLIELIAESMDCSLAALQ